MVVTDVDAVSKRHAKKPHELWMLNVFGFHLLLTPAILAAGVGMWGLLIPIVPSAVLIAYIYRRTRRGAEDGWFVAAHWRLTLGRARLLLIGYGATGMLMLLAWMATLGMERAETQEIMLTVLTRVAVMPTVILLFVTAVLESAAIYQVDRGEVSDSLARGFPPPEPGGGSGGLE